MAKKQQKEKSIEETLWDSANKLRGSVEPSEYKHVVLSLIFLKYAYDRFVERRDELIADGRASFVEQPVFYNAKNVFYLNEISRWDYLMENAKQNNIAIMIDTALAQVEKDNPTLKGALLQQLLFRFGAGPHQIGKPLGRNRQDRYPEGQGARSDRPCL